jgi:MoxR-like ATPase
LTGACFDAALVARVASRVTGRRDEIGGLVAALRAARHIVLEGPPGTGKSTLLRTIAQQAQLPIALVEGSAELTPARLIGWHDPSRVIAEGYTPASFVDGPLARMLREGGILYVEELNRVPEETLNVLVTVMSEGELNVARVGRIAAAPGFRFIAAMNPFDTVGTARIAAALADRMCRICVGYQTADEERLIVQEHAPDIPAPLVEAIVALVRATRDHAELRQGSSVRGAIDFALLAASYAHVCATPLDDVRALSAAMQSALSGRVRVDELSDRRAEDILRDLFERFFAAPVPEAGLPVPVFAAGRPSSAQRDGPAGKL